MSALKGLEERRLTQWPVKVGVVPASGKKGPPWRCRWRPQGAHGPQQSHGPFARKGDAEAWARAKERKLALRPDLAAGIECEGMTLEQFVQDDYWPRYAIPRLEESTRRRSLEIWGTHIRPQLGAVEVVALDALVLEDWIADMATARKGHQTQIKAIAVLSSILSHATRRRLISGNQMLIVAKPRAPVVAQPLAPVTVEAIRDELGRFDQMVIDLLAYQDMRPGEAIGLRWRNIGDRTVQLVASKNRRARAIKLLDPVAESLAEWRLASGRARTGRADPAAHLAVADPNRRPVTHDEWTRTDWQNFQGRIYKPAARRSGVSGDLRAYRLRCSFASLLSGRGAR